MASDTHEPTSRGARPQRSGYLALRPRREVRRAALAVVALLLLGVLAGQAAWLYRRDATPRGGDDAGPSSGDAEGPRE